MNKIPEKPERAHPIGGEIVAVDDDGALFCHACEARILAVF